MKTLRLIGMAIIAVIMSVNFVACDDDEDSDNVSLIGKWKEDSYIEVTNGVTTHYTPDDGGYPYLVFEEKTLIILTLMVVSKNTVHIYTMRT